MKDKTALIMGAVMMTIAVILGAMGAHALERFLSSGEITADQLASFETGVRYQIYHALALLIIGSGMLPVSRSVQKWTSRMIFFGTILFSVSIYLLATRNILGAGDGLAFLGPVTPIGGMCLILAWAWLTVGFIRYKQSTND